MLSLSPEWHEAPGVKDPVLAATWARLEIQAAAEGCEPRWPSSLISAATRSVRRGIYGSLFPLAEWVVENWWFLLYEPCRVPELTAGRRLAPDPSQRAWAGRHNLLAAREGGALPDLTIYRDGEQVVVQWAPDPEPDWHIHPVRFIEEGEARLSEAETERCLHGFVEAVVERLADSADDAAVRLRSNWRAVCESRQNEAELCAWAAMLALDPYDENELTDEFVELLKSRVEDLDSRLRSDLLEATSAPALPSDLDWLNEALPRLAPEIVMSNGENGSQRQPPAAHQLGYTRAHTFREDFGLPPEPIADLSCLLHERCGWPPENEHAVTVGGTTNVAALVGRDPGGSPRVIGPSLGHWANRFRLARSLFFLPDPRRQTHPRLITRAYTWDQKASRAFAAELLAPAEALRTKILDAVFPDDDQLDSLAHEFDVSPRLIEHQLMNHRIAWVDQF